jgi:hypothetical protein
LDSSAAMMRCKAPASTSFRLASSPTLPAPGSSGRAGRGSTGRQAGDVCEQCDQCDQCEQCVHEVAWALARRQHSGRPSPASGTQQSGRLTFGLFESVQALLYLGDVCQCQFKVDDVCMIGRCRSWTQAVERSVQHSKLPVAHHPSHQMPAPLRLLFATTSASPHHATGSLCRLPHAHAPHPCLCAGCQPHPAPMSSTGSTLPAT